MWINVIYYYKETLGISQTDSNPTTQNSSISRFFIGKTLELIHVIRIMFGVDFGFIYQIKATGTTKPPAAALRFTTE